VERSEDVGVTVRTLRPHGFCFGVAGAIEKARLALADGEVFAFHPLVHNDEVMRELSSLGLRSASSLDEVPFGAAVLFSAHGVPPSMRETAAKRNLRIVDATCPFVDRAHRAVRSFAERRVPVVIVGDASHAEVVGLAGEAEALAAPYAVVRNAADVEALPFSAHSPVGLVCQTTLNADDLAGVVGALRGRFPKLEVTPAASVCTATRDRQRAVRDFVLAARSAKPSAKTGVVVVGAAASANTNRLVATAKAAGADFAVRVSSAEEAEDLALLPLDSLGVTSGASTPESVLSAVAKVLGGLNFSPVRR